MAKNRLSSYEEPWSPQAIVVDALVSPDNKYCRFTKRQARALAEAWGLINIISSFMPKGSTTWLEHLLGEYEKRLKYIDGWAIKEASKVAKSSATRFMLNLSRWRRILMGREE